MRKDITDKTLQHKLAKMRRHIYRTGDLNARKRYNEITKTKALDAFYYRTDK